MLAWAALVCSLWVLVSQSSPAVLDNGLVVDLGMRFLLACAHCTHVSVMVADMHPPAYDPCLSLLVHLSCMSLLIRIVDDLERELDSLAAMGVVVNSLPISSVQVNHLLRTLFAPPPVL